MSDTRTSSGGKVEMVPGAPRCHLGESPRWDPDGGRLWWVDLLAGLVHSLEPATGRVSTTDVGQPATALGRYADGWVVAVETGVQYRDAEFRLLWEVSVLPRPTLMRMNDGELDPAGRFFVGSMSYDGRGGAAHLYRFDPDGICTVVLDGLDLSNGIAWSLDGTTMYHADSGTRIIRAHEYDPATGELGGSRVFYRHERDDAVPDGVALDAEGALWVALWGGSRVIRLSPDGVLADEIEVPAVQASSVRFGGSDLGTLYITSARVDLDEDELRRRPGNGALFSCRPGVTGAPQKLVRVTPTTRSAASTRKMPR